MDRRLFRPGWVVGHLMVLLAVLVCLRLGWWQWDRSHEATGTIQNLGYAVLWPCFGAAFIFMWIRFLHLEMVREDEEADEVCADGDGELNADAGEFVRDAVLAAPGTGDPSGPLSASDPDHDPDNSTVPAEPTDTAPQQAPDPSETPRSRASSPSRGVTIAVATVQDADTDDPQLAAYNQALAALAEKDRRRAQ